LNLDRTLGRLDALLAEHRFAGLEEVLFEQGALARSDRRAAPRRGDAS
jgi:hypothetical protein